MNKFRERVHTEEVKAKISLAQIGRKHSEETKAKFKDRIRSERSGIPKVSIEVFDQETGIKTIYPSIREAARVLEIDPASVSKYLSKGSVHLFKGRFSFKTV